MAIKKTRCLDSLNAHPLEASGKPPAPAIAAEEASAAKSFLSEAVLDTESWVGEGFLEQYTLENYHFAPKNWGLEDDVRFQLGDF